MDCDIECPNSYDGRESVDIAMRSNLKFLETAC